MNSVYRFCITAPDKDILLPQVSRLLEQALQTVSREQYPQLWKLTDRLNSVPKASEKTLKHRRIRAKIRSVIFLLLGIFLFVPGILKPGELTSALVVGAGAIICGIGGLRQNRKTKTRDPRYDRAAAQLLEEYVADESAEIAFSEDDHSANGSSIFESEDVFLLFTDSGTRILAKKDLTEGNIEEFRNFLRSRAAFFAENA